MATDNPPPSPWRISKAKGYLRSLLLDSSSWIHGLTAEQAHASEPQFTRYPLKNFKSNYKSMQLSTKKENDAIAFDQKTFDAEMISFPRKAATERGYLFWDGHPAQVQLADDVKEGRTTGKKPSDLREEREEYREFPLHVFRNHKYQEERKQNERVYWQKKRNDKGRQTYQDHARMQGGDP